METFRRWGGGYLHLKCSNAQLKTTPRQFVITSHPGARPIVVIANCLINACLPTMADKDQSVHASRCLSMTNALNCLCMSSLMQKGGKLGAEGSFEHRTLTYPYLEYKHSST